MRMKAVFFGNLCYPEITINVKQASKE